MKLLTSRIIFTTLLIALFLCNLTSLYAKCKGSGCNYPNPISWCSSASAMIDETLMLSSNAESVADARSILYAGINDIVKGFDGGSLEYQPITYTFLKRLLVIKELFTWFSIPTPPNTPQEYNISDQSAVIFFHNMLEVAREINENFDIPRFVPFIEMNRYCGYQCQDYDYEPIYAGYVDSVKRVLDRFFMPALSGKPEKGTLLDALAYDRKELEVVLSLVDWMVSEINKDVFRREFACVSAKLTIVRERINKYLNPTGTGYLSIGYATFNDMEMRILARNSLKEIASLMCRDSGRRSMCACGF